MGYFICIIYPSWIWCCSSPIYCSYIKSSSWSYTRRKRCEYLGTGSWLRNKIWGSISYIPRYGCAWVISKSSSLWNISKLIPSSPCICCWSCKTKVCYLSGIKPKRGRCCKIASKSNSSTIIYSNCAWRCPSTWNSSSFKVLIKSRKYVCSIIVFRICWW